MCDYLENSGEGKLARLFVQKLKKNYQFKIILNQQKRINQKYISVVLGIFYCWKKYFQNQKVCYLNYLPLWNFLIFIFLPPNTLLGPITGGSNYIKSYNFNHFIRGIIFPFCYKISEFFLNQRVKSIIFSTDLLRKYLFKNTIKKSKFNFVLNDFSYKKRQNKNIDILIYYRDHKNKKTFIPLNLVKKLIDNNFNIHVIGDRLNLVNIKNHGYVSKKKLSKLQSKSKYTFSTGENLYSFFIIECLSNHVKVILEKKYKFNTKVFKDKFIKINFKNLKGFDKLKRI